MTPLTHSALQRYRLVVAEWSCPTASPFYIYESAKPSAQWQHLLINLILPSHDRPQM